MCDWSCIHYDSHYKIILLIGYRKGCVSAKIIRILFFSHIIREVGLVCKVYMKVFIHMELLYFAMKQYQVIFYIVIRLKCLGVKSPMQQYFFLKCLRYFNKMNLRKCCCNPYWLWVDFTLVLIPVFHSI